MDAATAAKRKLWTGRVGSRSENGQWDGGDADGGGGTLRMYDYEKEAWGADQTVVMCASEDGEITAEERKNGAWPASKVRA